MPVDENDHRPPTAPIGTVVVPLPAELEYSSSQQVNALLAAAFSPQTRTVIADLTATIFCDSAGLRELILAHKLANAAHTELRLAIPNPNVARVFAITGLDRHLAIYPDLPAAMTTEPDPPPAPASEPAQPPATAPLRQPGQPPEPESLRG